ncbi:MAG: CheR family methyltransferase [Acidobacteriota bacterium]
MDRNVSQFELAAGRSPRETVREVVLAAGLCWAGYRKKWRSVWPEVRSAFEDSGCASLEEFLSRLRRDPALRGSLRPRLGITVSRFFRGVRTLETLLAALEPCLPESGEVRAWSAGCSCGEEPYTLAIFWEERIRPTRPDLTLNIVATDTREDCLERARRAIYPPSALRNVPAETRARHFEPAAGDFQFLLPRSVAVRFQRGDLLEDPPPTGCAVALCRNLAFTYFDTEDRLRACAALAQALEPGGFLAIGDREWLPPRALRPSSAGSGLPASQRQEGWFGPLPGDRTIFRRLPEAGGPAGTDGPAR